MALAYYGYRYAVASSVRSKASLMEGNQQLAQLLSEQIQDRIDKARRRAVRGGGVGRHGRPTRRPRSICRTGSSRWSLLDEALHIRSLYPAPDPAQRKRELDRWGSYVARARLEVAAALDARATPATSATCTSCSRASRC